jgi:hypothetical protein
VFDDYSLHNTLNKVLDQVEGHPYVVDRVLFECQSARFDEALAAQPRTSIAFDGVSRADFEVLLRAILPK